jgi:O-antigen/teichoic acid export membrane protein
MHDSILTNSVILAGSRFLGPFLSIILVAFISRELGVIGLGKYNLILTVFNIFMVPAHLGLAQYVTREIAKNRLHLSNLYLNLSLLGIGSSIFMCISMVVYAWLSYSENQLLFSFCLAAIGILPHTLAIYNLAVAAAHEKFHIHAIVRIVERFTRVTMGLLVLYAGYALIGLMTSFTLGLFIQLILSFFLIRKKLPNIRPKIDSSQMLSCLKISPAFLWIALSSTIFWKIDVLMLSKMQGMKAVGLYTAAYRLMEICFTIVLSFTTVVFPIAARLYQQNKIDFKNFCTNNIRYLLIGSLPTVVVIGAFGEKILIAIYGSELSEATHVFQILMLTLIPFGPAMILANALTAGDLQKLDMATISASMLFNVVANLVLIPRYGYLGAGYATLISVIFKLLLLMVFVSYRLYQPVLSIQFIKPFMGAAFMFIGIYSLSNLSVFIAVGGSLVIYFGIALISKTLLPSEIAWVRQIKYRSLFRINN